MEVTATLAGGRWTAAPRCVDPLLAALARAVNDCSSDAGRRGLLRFAPWLIGLAPGDAFAMEAALGGLAGRVLLGRLDAVGSGRVAARLATLRRTAGTSVRARWRRRRQAAGLVRLATRSLRRDVDADVLLAGLLADAVNATRCLVGLPALSMAPGDAVFPLTLPVQVEVRYPDGAESMYYHCTAVLEQWPAALRRAWQDRMDELAAPPDPGHASGVAAFRVPAAVFYDRM